VPIQVATKLASIRKPTFLAPSPEAYARAAVRHIGYEPRCSPYWTHALVGFLISLLPEPIADRMFLHRNLSIRARGRAKDAKKKAQ
jgi:17beta-estradiol 17-dehydrogenase / very-long-chain 3-oxoacyl-CoA reductase